MGARVLYVVVVARASVLSFGLVNDGDFVESKVLGRDLRDYLASALKGILAAAAVSGPLTIVTHRVQQGHIRALMSSGARGCPFPTVVDQLSWVLGLIPFIRRLPRLAFTLMLPLL